MNQQQSVHPLSAGRGGWASSQIFKKGGGAWQDLKFYRGGGGKEGATFSGGLQLSHKK